MNYSKMSGQLVCKTAMLLAFVFAACSDNQVSGGVTEETRVYALTGRIGDVAPKVMRLRGIESAVDNNGVQLDASKATTVAVYELDSLTLEATGRVFMDTIENVDGQFSFGDIALNTPYALVEIQDSCIAEECKRRGVWGSENYKAYIDVPCNYDSLFAADPSWAANPPTSCSITDSTKYPLPLSAIVDVRKYPKLSANSLSYMKIPLVKKYFAEGMTFAEASKKAEQDILANFGIYEDLGDFESLESVNGELSYVLQMMSHVTRTGILFEATLPINLDAYYGISPAAIAALGSRAEELYSNTVKLLEYEVAYYAGKKNIGRCTSSRENETHDIPSMGINSIVCHSGKWVPGWKKVEYTNGTMTDARDGKTYKTVTYNWNGVTQTWLAENLNYADTASSEADSAMKVNLLGSTICLEGDPTCESFGRIYTWKAAANLSWADLNLTSVVMNEVYDETKENKYVITYDTVAVEDMCLTAKYDDLGGKYEYCAVKTPTGDCYALDTAASVYEYCNNRYRDTYRFDVSRVIPESGAAFQGVCPDGWRLPSWEDWSILQKNVKSQGASIRDAYGSGFGYMDMMTLKLDNTDVPKFNITNRIHYYQAKFISALSAVGGVYEGFFGGFDYDLTPTPTELNESDDAEDNAYVSNSYGNVRIDMLNAEAPVRCIKN